MENFGIYINGKFYCDAILDGRKTVETRNMRTLDRFIGKRVAIIQSGESHGSCVVGYVTISGRKWYPAYSFHSAENQMEHLVPAGSKYDSKNGKYGYILENPVRIKPVKHIKNESSRIYQTLAFTESETEKMEG